MNTVTFHLVPEQTEQNSTNPGSGNIFYEAVFSYAQIPNNIQSVMLCPNSDEDHDMYADDAIKIFVNGTQIYYFDFSTANPGRITPIEPVDVTNLIQRYQNSTVKIESQLLDYHPGKQSSSGFRLVINYNS